MIPTRFIQELGRQFRLDLRDDEIRRKAQEEEKPSYEQEKDTCQDGGSGEEMPREQENLEKCNHASGGEELIACGQRRRTWIITPAKSGPAKEQEKEARVPEQESQQTTEQQRPKS
jgi:hypothetical protein